MTNAELIRAMQATIARSSAVLAAVENSLRAGAALVEAPGIPPTKPASALDGAARPTLQSHGGR